MQAVCRFAHIKRLTPANPSTRGFRTSADPCVGPMSWNDLPDDVLNLAKQHGAAMAVQRRIRHWLSRRADGMHAPVHVLPVDHVQQIPDWWLPGHNQLMHVPSVVVVATYADDEVWLIAD